MAAIRLTLVILAGLFCLRCSLGESDLQRAAKDFRVLHGNNWGIADISFADRFGEGVITVGCVSEEDRGNLRSSLPNYFKGFRVHLAGPMWGIGGLTADSADTKKLLVWIRTPPYNVGGTSANKEMEALADKVEATDSAVWASWSQEQRRQFVSDWIKKERKRIEGYANCGDKFLLSN